jgi:metal transporter CNNM
VVQLKKLFDLHASSGQTLTHEETTILAGALDFGTKTVEQVMTPLDKVFMLSIDDVLSRETITRILNAGYSRVPVYQDKPSNIVALLFVKDLALVNPDVCVVGVHTHTR